MNEFKKKIEKNYLVPRSLPEEQCDTQEFETCCTLRIKMTTNPAQQPKGNNQTPTFTANRRISRHTSRGK